MRDQAEVCPLSREVMLRIRATSIHAITARHSLFPPSFTRSAISAPYGCLPIWEHYGLIVFEACNEDGVGSLCAPVVNESMTAET